MVKTRIEMLRVVEEYMQQESVMVMKHLNIVTRNMNINAIRLPRRSEQESVMKHLNIVTKDMNINAVVSRGGRESMG